jgi:acyl-CoA thioesterase
MSHLTDREQRLLDLMRQLSEDDQQLALAAVERYVAHPEHGGPLTWMLGVQYTEVRGGFARCHVDIDRGHHNPGGIAHGAVAYALIDSAMGAAFYYALERPLGCATLELKINYVRPIVTGRMEATAELIERTTRFGILTGRVLDEHDQLVALAQGTFAILRPKG